MNFSIDGAKRMQSLINGLLEYSRIGTQGKKPQKVNSKDALDEALARLHASIEESGAKIIADDLPTVYFDDLQLARLFQNLIGNAIKFRSDQTPQIHISAVRKDGGWQFAVRDNGIGIEPQYAERIFMIFQRLHTRKTLPRNRHRPVNLQENRRTPRRKNLGRIHSRDTVQRFISLFLT